MIDLCPKTTYQYKHAPSLIWKESVDYRDCFLNLRRGTCKHWEQYHRLIITEITFRLLLRDLQTMGLHWRRGGLLNFQYSQVLYVTLTNSLIYLLLYIRFIDVDECSDSGTCPANSWCNNTDGSYMCTCYQGYRQIGHQCQGSTLETYNMFMHFQMQNTRFAFLQLHQTV